jgi:hypothetical protein
MARRTARGGRRWRRGLLWTILAGFAIAIVVSLAGVVLGDDTLPPLGLGIAVLGLVVALVLAAYLGGQALARFGGLVGLALVAGVVLAFAGGLIAGWVQWVGIGVAVLSVVGFFVMGFRRGAPVWIGDRLNSD